MSDSDAPQVPTPDPPRQQPQRLHDDPDTHNDLTDFEDPLEEEAEHGRIGYGRFGEWTPYALAAAIILTIVIIATINWLDEDGESPSDEQTTSEAVASGPAPAFVTTLVNGQGFDLAANRGSVVVVNFWATWCAPCKDEMPALQQLASANSDVVVIGIAEPNDKADAVQSFADDLGVTYPLAIDGDGYGPIGAIASSYQVFGYPSTFFIDAEGNLVDSIYGPFPLEDLQTYLDRARSTTSD